MNTRDSKDIPVNFVWTQFSTDYAVEHEDHVLAVSGSLPALGQWSVRQAVLADGVQVRFETRYKTDTQTKCLAVCGSLDPLGSWETKHAVTADENPENSGKWVVTVILPANATFEWKWVVIWQENKTAFRWEERGNRVTELGEHSCRCYAPWNGDMSYGTISQVSDGQWTTVDNEQVEKLAEDPAGLTQPHRQQELGLISSYLRDMGVLISWSLQNIRSGVVAFFHMLGGVFRRDSSHDHVD